MRRMKPIDIEDVLQKDLSQAAAASGLSISISGTPVPSNLGANLPYAVIERVGGSRWSELIDKHAVSIDVWSNRWAVSNDYASELVSLVQALPDMDDSTVDYYEAGIDAFPYNNPDLRHEDLPRVSFTATVICRAKAID